jgi:twitching motility protein PilT
MNLPPALRQHPPPFQGGAVAGPGLDAATYHELGEQWRQFLEGIMARAGVSDVVLTSFGRCTVRAHGQLGTDPLPANLTGGEPFAALTNLLFSDADTADSGSQEAVVEIRGRRLRAVEVHCEGGREITLRVIAQKIPLPREIRLPESVMQRFREADGGLFLVAGATGSGKSTTIASLLQAAARQERIRVVSIEDPVEYRFTDDDEGSIFTQRQLGRDCPDYVSGLKRALRMNPDVIFVGEVRDATVAEMVIEAASTGHRVLTTIHAWDPISALRRLMGMAASEGGTQAVRDALADCIQLCLAQKLVSAGRGQPRVAIHEILTRTEAVVFKIRQDQIPLLKAEMETGRKFGMLSFQQSIALRQSENALPPGYTLGSAAP